MVLGALGYMTNADFEEKKLVNDNLVQSVFINNTKKIMFLHQWEDFI